MELIGPAGAGKSTLQRALSQRFGNILPDIQLTKYRLFPFFISNSAALLPTYFWRYRGTRWFNRRESRSMAYLKAGLNVVRQQASINGTITILDHGPIYRLAFLRALGPEITESQTYRKWWTGLLHQWAIALDGVIWLDAPNNILLERVRTRDQLHCIKSTSKQAADKYLTDYREFLQKTIAETMTDRQAILLRFDTNEESVEQIADRISATLNCTVPLTTIREVQDPV